MSGPSWPRKKEVTADWMRQPEVLGTAVGLDSSGNTSLLVYIDQDAKMPAK